MKLVYVEWHDAMSMDTVGWAKPKKVVEQLSASVTNPCISVGFVLKRTKKVIILASSLTSYEDPPEVDGTIAIPIAWITKLKELKH